MFSNKNSDNLVGKKYDLNNVAGIIDQDACQLFNGFCKHCIFAPAQLSWREEIYSPTRL